MPGIWNINSSYDINTKKVSRQLSFDIGQIFLARVEDLEQSTGEAILKLLDGWKFSAKLDGQLEQLPKGILKFIVEGFVDGKLQLKLIEGEKENNEQQSSIDGLLKDKNLNLKKEDYPILDKMIKHNIPLTKENMSNVKTVIDFINKMNNNPNEDEVFINKYLANKNIQPDSIKGESVKNILKGFFTELKNMSSEEVLTFFENNIDITEENIKSFNNLFKESNGLYKDVKSLESNINTIISNDKNNIKGNSELNNKDINTNEFLEDKDNAIETLLKNNTKTDEFKDGKSQIKTQTTEKLGLEQENKNISNLNNKNTENNKEILDSNLNVDKDIMQNVKDKNIKTMTKLNSNNIDELTQSIKEQINIKTEDIKNIIKSVVESKSEAKPELYNNILQTLDKSINDFKIFNSVSNQYYYLDVPLNVDNSEYQCKLMIKDERKKGKQIDSTNVKIAASVSTNNMGVIDAYIKVNNNNMDVDIKCDELWIKTLNKEKEKLLISLEELKYKIFFKVEKKEDEMNIVNCREFFEDYTLGVINTKV